MEIQALTAATGGEEMTQEENRKLAELLGWTVKTNPSGSTSFRRDPAMTLALLEKMISLRGLWSTLHDLAVWMERLGDMDNPKHFEHESFPECPEGEIPANVTILHTHLPETPIDMLLFCPVCHMQHIDEPKGEWTNPPHKSHLCRVEDGGCGTIFRPADVATNGVRAIQTSGQNDTWRMTRHAI